MWGIFLWVSLKNKSRDPIWTPLNFGLRISSDWTTARVPLVFPNAIVQKIRKYIDIYRIQRRAVRASVLLSQVMEFVRLNAGLLIESVVLLR